ncbi:hypothetical protein BT93_K1458 [Corymbia citriodora subsp. variegata]|nr:hypothetical protein BT93_K1458 [Corymbia citriodora subsp. variegata]
MGTALKIFMRLVVCYLGFSWFLLVAAVPAIRSLRSNNEIKLLPKVESLSLDDVELIKAGGTHKVEGRMDIETNDYPPVGPNPRHNPPPPPHPRP